MSAESLRRVARTLVPFLLAFAAMLVAGYQGRELRFYGDAYETWEVAKSLFAAGDPYRSFVEYRGFVIFVLCGGIYQISSWLAVDDIATFRVFGALAFAALTTVSLPALFSRLLDRPASVARTIAFSAVAFYFFRGYFLFPSSDYLALYFLVLALNRVLAAEGNPAVALGVAGLWMAAAVFSRSNYVVCVPLLMALSWLRMRGLGGPPRRFAVGMACFLAAMGTVAVANHQYAEYRSATAGPVETEGWRVLNGQLTNGLKMQKIEWSIDSSYAGMVVFSEPTGLAVLEEEGVEGWLRLPQYLALLAARPLDFTGMYARHLFNGLDISYPSVYVADVRRDRFWFSLFNYSLIFAGMVVAAVRVVGRPGRAPAVVGFAVLVLHALFCVPFPVEPRFFLALLMGLHGLAVFGLEPPARSGLASWRRTATWVAILYIVFVAGCFVASERTFAQIQGEPLPLRLPWEGDVAGAALP